MPVPQNRDRAGQFWLTILGHAAGAQWVLQNSRMAFGAGQARRATRIRPGDRLFLYTSRGAFNNPTRDEAQLLGMARVLTPVTKLRRPEVIAGREFVVGCELQIDLTLPLRRGVAFRPLVRRMRFIARKDIWSAYMRSSLIQLPSGDAQVLKRTLEAARPKADA